MVITGSGETGTLYVISSGGCPCVCLMRQVFFLHLCTWKIHDANPPLPQSYYRLLFILSPPSLLACQDITASLSGSAIETQCRKHVIQVPSIPSSLCFSVFLPLRCCLQCV